MAHHSSAGRTGRNGPAGSKVASRNADMKWKRKIVIGLETLMRCADQHPEAKSVMDELCRQVPLDSTESDKIRPNPAKSDL